MKLNYLSGALLVGLLALPGAMAFADEEADLIAILQSSAGVPEKCNACARLRVVGTAKAVPAMAALLGQEATAHAARYGLEGLPCPEAVAALRQALGQTSGRIKAGLVDSLGWRRDSAAVPLLVPLLSGDDRDLSAAAASALGRIGGREALKALRAGCDAAPESVRLAMLEGLLQCAESLLVVEPRQAAALYRQLVDAKYPDSVRVAAWRGLVLADARRRPRLVTEALAGQDRLIRTAALTVLRQLNDPSVLQACLRQWTTLPAEGQLAVLDARVKTGPDALPAVQAATASAHPAVRVAAWQAVGDLGGPSFVPALAKAAANGEPSEREAARDALARLQGPGVREALLNQLAVAATNEKVELLRALGERHDAEAGKALLQNAGPGPEPVRAAALDALRKVASPPTFVPLLDLVAGCASDAEGAPVIEAIRAVCQASPDKDQLTRDALARLEGFSADGRRRALPVLAELATPPALQTVQAATRDPDPATVKEAVRVLAQWPDAAPAAGLFELARAGSDPTVQTLALRAGINVAALEPDLTRRMEFLQQAITLARRPEEKQQALGHLPQIATPAALQVAVRHLNEPALVNEAGLAAVTIAEKLAKANPALASETAGAVLARCKAPEVVKRAWALRGQAAGKGPFIQNWLVCGPFSQPGATGAEAVFKIAFGPEKPGESVQWTPVPRGDQVNLAALFPGRDNCVAYLKAEMVAPEECDAALLLGSDDGVIAWLNGEVVHSNNVDRGDVPDQDMAPIHLRQGTNELRLKITQGGGGWSAHARIVGADGQPIPGLRNP